VIAAMGQQRRNPAAPGNVQRTGPERTPPHSQAPPCSSGRPLRNGRCGRFSANRGPGNAQRAGGPVQPKARLLFPCCQRSGSASPSLAASHTWASPPRWREPATGSMPGDRDLSAPAASGNSRIPARAEAGVSCCCHPLPSHEHSHERSHHAAYTHQPCPARHQGTTSR